jgi:hypothetical protein
MFNTWYLFSQAPIGLDKALQQIVDSIYNSVSIGSTIFISDIQSSSYPLTEYSTNKLIGLIVNDRRKENLIVVERSTQNLDLMNKEINYQLSGEVSDETALSLGRKVGAEVIVIGSIKQYTENFILHIRIIHIETGRILGIINETIKNDKELKSFMSENRRSSQTRDNRQNIQWYNDEWMNNWLYLSIRFGFTPIIYKLNSNIDMNAETYFSITPVFQIGFHLTKHLFLQTELIYLNDKVKVNEPENILIKSASLTIPVIAKFGFSYNVFHYAFLGGLAFPIGLGNLKVNKNGTEQEYEYTIPFGLIIGINLGFKLGPGIVFTDIRLLQDLGYINANAADQYSRTKICITFGYDFALLGK